MRALAFPRAASAGTIGAHGHKEQSMAKMKAAMAAVLVMEKEGVTQAFGVPGAAINPFYAQL